MFADGLNLSLGQTGVGPLMASMGDVPDISRNVMSFRFCHIGKTAFFSLKKLIMGPF
jgi:hypothetical protein